MLNYLKSKLFFGFDKIRRKLMTHYNRLKLSRYMIRKTYGNGALFLLMLS